MLWLFVAAAIQIAFGVLSVTVAGRKNRDRVAWFLIGLIFGPFGFVASLVVDQVEPSQKAGIGGAIKQRFFDIRRDEWPRALALSAFFFLVIAIFWILKPIKKGALIGFYAEDPLLFWGMTFGGAEVEQLAKVLNMLVIYGVVILFTLMARHLKRQQIVYVFCVLISGLLLVFSYVMAQPGPAAAWSFYVFGDIFNSIMVATFWAFTNDVNRPEQSKRLYGMIGLGGVIGGFIGASFVSGFVEQEGVGRSGLILGCIAGMAIIAAIAFFVNRWAGGAEGPAASGEERTPVNAAVEGAKLVFQSKYLLAILGIIGLYEIVSNIIEFQLSAAVETSALAGPDIDAFFGNYGMLIGVVSISVQLILTPYLMNRWSVGVALMVLPVVDLVLSAGFLVFPVLGMAAALSIADNGLNYSINQSAKESLYTPTSPDAKYKGKAFIDMFIQRGAKVLAVGLNLAFAALVSIAAVQWLSIASIVVLVAWILVVRFAGKRFAERAEGAEPSEGEAPREEVTA